MWSICRSCSFLIACPPRAHVHTMGSLWQLELENYREHIWRSPKISKDLLRFRKISVVSDCFLVQVSVFQLHQSGAFLLTRLLLTRLLRKRLHHQNRENRNPRHDLMPNMLSLPESHNPKGPICWAGHCSLNTMVFSPRLGHTQKPMLLQSWQHI